jgi:L-arabinose isomerase
MFNTVRIWIKPRLPVAPFREEYSRNGGTHHSALVLGDVAEAIAAFGRQTGLDVVTIG